MLYLRTRWSQRVSAPGLGATASAKQASYIGRKADAILARKLREGRNGFCVTLI
jgi:hypothetical protein